MSQQPSFRESIHDSFQHFLKEQEDLLPRHNYLKIDLHCHDHRSSVPDELLGRLLNVPETWLPTKELVKTLQKQKTDLITITNHNNATSCFELKEQGMDVLVGTEFTCHIPEYAVSIHVLAYGFDREQEDILNDLRYYVYDFLRFCKEEEIPTIWAHPLYFYSPSGIPPMEFFHKMVLVFERFEVINGQRDSWQNLLVKSWLESYTPEQLDRLAEKFAIQREDFCIDPYRKAFFAGSDSHMGLFAGTTGTYLIIDKLAERRQKTPLSDLAKEAILLGNSAVYGTHQTNEKLNMAFVDYFLQVAQYKKDPGLIRLLLHKGDYQDKLLALLISNAVTELQFHGMTMRFVKAFHKAFRGKRNLNPERFIFNQAYRDILKQSKVLGQSANESGEAQLYGIKDTIDQVYETLSNLFYKRLERKLEYIKRKTKKKPIDPVQLLSTLELPADIRHYFKPEKKFFGSTHRQYPLIRLLDGLSFPFLASNLLLAAEFTSTKVLFNNRKLLNEFAENLGQHQHPKRILWLTDTFDDKNGVALVLQSMLKEVQSYELPIDFLVCSHEVEPDAHLFIVKPRMEFETSLYPNQRIRIPDLKEIHRLFQNGENDQVICSTEGFMGFAALYLKQAFTVPASFFMHTDWLQFAKDSGKMNQKNLDKLRRILREFYKQFDSVFVLNSEHRNWLASAEMMVDRDKIFQTAHWVESYFAPRGSQKKELFGLEEDEPVLLFSGRLSREKGVFDVVEIYRGLQKRLPKLRLVIAGSGPMESELKEQLPTAIFTGWLAHAQMPELYSSADLLLLPSRFDTFSVVVLEAMSCGLPVAAYPAKGPKEIIQSNSNGFLAKDIPNMISQITLYFLDDELQEQVKMKALKRAGEFDKKKILQQFLKDLGVSSDPVSIVPSEEKHREKKEYRNGKKPVKIVEKLQHKVF